MLSINNVPYRDTFRFMREVNEVLENDFENVFALLTEFLNAENEIDLDDERPTREPMRVPEFGSTHVSVRRVSKEVK